MDAATIGVAGFSDRALWSALGECLLQVRREGLLATFEAARAGSLERGYLALAPAAVRCEAWLIRWPPGTIAPLHDHGTAHGLAQVLSGALDETRFASSASRALYREWTPEQVIVLPVGACHEVRNVGAGVAYSIHVYAPRLEHMTFYDRGAAGELRPLRQELADQWRINPHG